MISTQVNLQFGFFTGPTTLFCMTRLFIIEEVLQFSDYQSFLFIAKVVYYFYVLLLRHSDKQ